MALEQHVKVEQQLRRNMAMELNFIKDGKGIIIYIIMFYH